MRLRTETVGDVMVAHVDEGRIDAAGAVEFKGRLRDALDGHDGHLVIDLAAVEFLDSSGLGALVAVMKMLGGRPLELAAPGPIVRRVLSLTRMDEVFVLHDDRDAALASARAA